MSFAGLLQELEQGKRELEIILTEGEERIKNIEAAKRGTSHATQTRRAN